MTELERWRLILGKKADPENEVQLNADGKGMDKVLDALYDAERKGGLGSSSPNVNRWLGDIRTYFPSSMVQVMQKDALERLGLTQLLTEPEVLEMVEPDIHLVTTLLSLKQLIPNKTKDTARMVVRKVVEQLEKKIKPPLIQAISGSLNRSVVNRRPKLNEMNWNKTVQINLKNYQPELGTIIPEHFRGYGRKGQALKTVILLMDQSGSMATSVVYASIIAAVMGSLRSLKTYIAAFDTNVVDLTQHLHDPVEILFGVQLGGGTDINKALIYAEKLISRPNDTIIVLISDLFEGGNEKEMLRRTANLVQSGVQFISLLALTDEGAPAFNQEIAPKFAQMNIPSFACTPDEFPNLMAKAIEQKI